MWKKKVSHQRRVQDWSGHKKKAAEVLTCLSGAAQYTGKREPVRRRRQLVSTLGKASQCGAPMNRTRIGGMALGEVCSGDGCEQRKNSATHQIWRGEGDWSATEKKQPKK